MMVNAGLTTLKKIEETNPREIEMVEKLLQVILAISFQSFIAHISILNNSILRVINFSDR